jgi:Zn finger protein HypA/HybF involved in hydrogenase expression
MARKPVTLNRIMRMVERDDNQGICTACGATAHNVEPDAREYTCESCGAPKVYGAQELLFMLA